MPNNFLPTGVEYFRILPEIILTVAGMVIMLLEGISRDDDHPLTAPVSFVAIVAALAAALAALSDPGAAFQQMLIDLTGLPVANASLLDEATAAGEALGLIQRSTQSAGRAFFVDEACHPQVIAVVRTRARWLGIPLVVGDASVALDPARVFGAHLQYPDTCGRIADPAATRGPPRSVGGLAVRAARADHVRRLRARAAADDRAVLDAAMERHRPIRVRGPR